MLRLAPISCSGGASVGFGATPITMSRPRSAIALALLTVASTALAPPRGMSAAATSSVALSMKWCARSLRASAALSPPRAIATVRKPSLLANCIPRCRSCPNRETQALRRRENGCEGRLPKRADHAGARAEIQLQLPQPQDYDGVHQRYDPAAD